MVKQKKNKIRYNKMVKIKNKRRKGKKNIKDF